MSVSKLLKIDPIEEVILDAKAGKLFILVDDQDRENEGDLCIIAEHATPDAIYHLNRSKRGGNYWYISA